MITVIVLVALAFVSIIVYIGCGIFDYDIYDYKYDEGDNNDTYNEDITYDQWRNEYK